MKREIRTTDDGSVTLHIPEWNEQYHSKHGALVEAQYVFIDQGLHYFWEHEKLSASLAILEIGFGTGLNAFLTLLEAEKYQKKIDYTGVEGFPVTEDEVKQLNYPQLLSTDATLFQKMHTLSWETSNKVTSFFTLQKREQKFEAISDQNSFHLIYFDAFGSRVQPELWEKNIFQKMYDALLPGGVLVTYSSKGSVKRLLPELGFEVTRLAGPPGKRHMLRAIKKKSDL